MVKRTDLIRKIQKEARANGRAFQLVRNSGDHEIWSLEGTSVSIPRYTEINERTGEGIYWTLDSKLGKDWWR